jgi:hypothetical protein
MHILSSKKNADDVAVLHNFNGKVADDQLLQQEKVVGVTDGLPLLSVHAEHTGTGPTRRRGRMCVLPLCLSFSKRYRGVVACYPSRLELRKISSHF